MSAGDERAARVRELLAEVLDVPLPSIGPGFSAATAGSWTSLNHLMLVSQLEGEFGVIFTNAEIGELTSFDRIVSALAQHLEPG
ncbi:MAG: acyl carrier protein [Gemmatimonadales bacterium]|nr:acyl carrier protein [Gemmatimonadales bacterium]